MTMLARSGSTAAQNPSKQSPTLLDRRRFSSLRFLIMVNKVAYFTWLYNYLVCNYWLWRMPLLTIIRIWAKEVVCTFPRGVG